MEAHTEIVRERAQAAYAETLEATVRIQVFGQPTGALLDALHEQAGNGVELSINGEHLGGFTARPPNVERGHSHAFDDITTPSSGPRELPLRSDFLRPAAPTRAIAD